MPQKIGIWGGSFDPVHIGHLILAQEVLVVCQLDRIIWVPSGDPPHKSGPGASGDDRVQMVELAIEGEERFSVSRVEVDRSGKSYTAETLEDLRRTECERLDRFCLLIGIDNAVDFENWHEPERVLGLADVVVLGRPGFSRRSISPSLAGRLNFLDTPVFEMSSTSIRKRLQEGISIRYWVPDTVKALIEARRLYV